MKRRNATLPVALLFILVPLVCGGCRTRSAGSLAKEMFLELATQKALEEGIDVADSDVLYDEGNSEWREYHRTNRSATSRIADALHAFANSDYQAVRFSPKTPMLGGVLWVFVERDSGDIITLYGEE